GGSEPVRLEASELLEEARRAADRGAKNKELLTAWLDAPQGTVVLPLSRDGLGKLIAGAPSSGDERFGAALRKCGLDIDRVSADGAVARFKSLPKLVVQEVVAGLDSWTEQRQNASRQERDWRKLAAVANRLDSNPLRGELRRLRLDSALRRTGFGP